MASYDIQGKLYEKFDEQQVSDKFRKREFVVEVPDGSYTQYIKLQLSQDKCDLLNNFKVGDEVKATFNLQGKPFTKNGTTMYFTNLQAWKLEASTGASYDTAPSNNYGGDEPEDLPF